MPLDLSSLADGSGVYLFKNRRGEVIYVGQSGQLSQRVKSYFQTDNLGPKTKKMIREVGKIKTIPVSSPIEALLLEAELIRRYQPKYNSKGKDDKGLLLIRISAREKVPTLSLVRVAKDDRATYLGPLPQAWLTRKLLRQLRPLFPYCTHKSGYEKKCLYRQLNLCGSPARDDPPKILKSYRKMINQLIRLLRGNVSPYLDDLAAGMKRAANREDFETAGKYRDKINLLENLFQKVTRPGEYLRNPNLLEDIQQAELEDLRLLLEKKGIQVSSLNRIEAFDISHFAGQGAVGSMVVFSNGAPLRKDYRHFKIREGKTQDDLVMMAEIINRRFASRNKKDLSFGARPDLLLIDGGLGQIRAVGQVLKKRDLTTQILGLEKPWETLVIPAGQGNKVNRSRLKPGSPSRLLLQRIRDEAHRFAWHYHRHLREKSLLGS